MSEVRASIVSAPASSGLEPKKTVPGPTRSMPRCRCRSCRRPQERHRTDEKFCKRVGVPLAALRAAQETDVTVAVAPCKMVALSPAPRVAAPQVLDDAARAAAVLSYKHHEPHLLGGGLRRPRMPWSTRTAPRRPSDDRNAAPRAAVPDDPRAGRRAQRDGGRRHRAVARGRRGQRGPSPPPRRSLVGSVDGLRRGAAAG